MLLRLFEKCDFWIGFAGAARSFPVKNFGEAPVHHQHFTERPDHDISRALGRDAGRCGLGERNRITDAEKNPQRSGKEVTDSMYLSAAAFHKFHV